MFDSKSVAVVVPCYNERTQVETVLETMPAFVDAVIVVDDQSRDGTADVVDRWIETAGGDASRVTLIRHETNSGVGAAIVTGYREAMRRQFDVTAVMAGDGQMPPEELPLLVGPVARGEADYAKGNRLFHSIAWKTIPRHRYLGNAFLSMLTKIASGYWHVADSQAGYTAISLDALEMIDLDEVYARYGYPNDMLVRLNVFDMRVADVHVRPCYNVGEQSKMKVWKVIPTMSWLIFKRFCWRMFHKYVIHDFHPLVMFYGFGAIALVGGGAFGLYLVIHRLAVGPVSGTSALLAALLVLSGLQLVLFAMGFDMEMNRHTRVEVSRPRRRGGPEAGEPTSDDGDRVAAEPVSESRSA